MASSSAAAASMASGPSSVTQDYIPLDPWLKNPNTPLFVGVAVLGSTAAGTAAGATYGMFRDINPYRTAMSMGGRWLVASASFFGVREYMITPLLTNVRATTAHEKKLRYLSEKQLGKLPAGIALTRGEKRTQNLLDSGITGLLVGSLASWALLGRRRVIRSAITSMLGVTILQFSVNSARLLKSDLFDPQSKHPITTATADPAILPTDHGSPAIPGTETDHEQSRWQRFTGRVVTTAKAWSPIKKLSLEEQLERHRDRRQWLGRKLNAIEAEEIRLYEQIKGSGLLDEEETRPA